MSESAFPRRRRAGVRGSVSPCRLALALGGVAALGLAGSPTTARAADAVPGAMYRCPGNDYNNTLSAKEAKDRGCRTLEGAPITIIQTPKPRPVPAASGASAARVDPTDQRARDTDARRILEAELQREQERLAQMQTDYNNGQPERQSNEKSIQKYLDRVADMKTAIARKESDIAAIKREIQKLPS